MAVYLSALFGAGAQLFDNSGIPLALGTLQTFQAGSTTPIATYIDNTQTTQNGTTINLDSAGRPPQEIWLLSGQSYKFIVKNAAGVQVGNAYDNISGINDPGNASSGSLSMWAASGLTPTYLSATTFSVTGDQRSLFPVGTRLKTTNTGGTIYSTVSAVAFGSFTTVTVVNDSSTLDSGLSLVWTSVSTVTGLPVGAATIGYQSALTYPANSLGLAFKTIETLANNQTKATVTGGTSTAYTLTPTPAVAAYVTGQTYLASINASSGSNPTMAISGLAAKNLKQLNSAGTKVAASLFAGQGVLIEYDGTDLLVLNPLSASTGASGSLKRVTTFTATGTWTKQTDAPTVLVKVVGGGAGGKGGDSSANQPGGGGGGYSEKFISAPGATEAVTIGAAGAGGTVPDNLGGSGSTSSFGSWCTATGGTSAGVGGAGASGDVNLTGQTGTLNSGGNSPAFNGAGASVGGGIGANAIANTGGGGGGGGTSGVAGFAGGNGAAGIVIVYEFG